MLLPGSVLDAGRRRQSGPGQNGFGTGCRSASGRGVPEPAGDRARLSVGYPAYRMANSPHSGYVRIVSIRTKNSADHGRVRIGRFWACQHGKRLPRLGRPLTRNRRRQLCVTITGRG
jgi:hypothetical protein